MGHALVDFLIHLDWTTEESLVSNFTHKKVLDLDTFFIVLDKEHFESSLLRHFSVLSRKIKKSESGKPRFPFANRILPTSLLNFRYLRVGIASLSEFASTE